MSQPNFKPALIVVDVQEDFCPPNGALPIATLDWHPQPRFLRRQPPRRIPFASTKVIKHPEPAGPPSSDSSSSKPPIRAYETTLWPVHCVQDTPGAAPVAGLDTHLDSGLAALLRAQAITHVYVAGLAADYCVRVSALDAHAEGFVTYIVDEATRPVVPEKWTAVRGTIERKGVKVVSMDGDEVERVRELAAAEPGSWPGCHIL
ncbi:unnamed protein product [Parascedosporium putredinis]|uniref:nicotinamidase n=1 Tax=Parascedosporium putredinis TaxID=1442378 RepID=A0A9P1H9I4_9PEZI|nr:unnamed protein product [Parascedosporium putredinis]CAI8001904.1 unnamed protein product [Parascedosporium putredinis]